MCAKPPRKNERFWRDQSGQLSDTHPEIARLHAQMLSQLPAWRKAEMIGQLFQTSRDLAQIGLRAQHPDATEAHLRRLLADLLLGPELAEAAYGPYPSPPSEQ